MRSHLLAEEEGASVLMITIERTDDHFPAAAVLHPAIPEKYVQSIHKSLFSLLISSTL